MLPAVSAADPELDRLLLLYYAGQCPPAELARVERAIAERPFERRVLAVLAGDGGVEPTADERAAALDIILQRVRGASGVSTVARSARPAPGARAFRGIGDPSHVKRWMAGAAALMIAGVAVLLLRPTASGHGGITRTYATTAGQRATLRLADGSRVVLAPRTTMRLTDFGAATRTIDVDGQAYFDVAGATRTPFIVRSGAIAVRVLGTTFAVRHYSADRDVRVAVSSGRVAVTSLTRSVDPVTVGAGRMAVVTDSTTVLRDARDDGDMAWVRGNIAFDHAPVTEVLATLTRWYGYEFRVDSTIMRQSVTVWVSTESSAEALSTLSHLLDLTVSVQGDTVTMVPRHAARRRNGLRGKTYDVWTPTREVGR